MLSQYCPETRSSRGVFYFLQVLPGTEGLAAASQKHGPGRRIPGASVECLLQFECHFTVEGVENCGPVQGQDSGLTLHIEIDVLHDVLDMMVKTKNQASLRSEMAEK
jgi:hypothetical protein